MKQTTKPRKPAVRKIKPKEVKPIPIEAPKILNKQDTPDKFELKPGVKYEPHILKLLDIQGFYELWISRIAYSETYEAAYELAEGFFESYFARRRFSSYGSFRTSVSQWLKKRNDNKN